MIDERMSTSPRLKCVLLLGGHSTRMGTPKHLLPFLDGKPLFQHTLEHISKACPDAEGTFISTSSAINTELLQGAAGSVPFTILHDVIEHDSAESSIGPAAGLLAAYRHDPDALWLVVACDFPLLVSATIIQLRKEFEMPLTCFRNEESWSEPLLAIWSPQALKKLEENVVKGILGPIRVIRDLGGKEVEPDVAYWLYNANTKEDWARALAIAAKQPFVSSFGEL